MKKKDKITLQLTIASSDGPLFEKLRALAGHKGGRERAHYARALLIRGYEILERVPSVISLPNPSSSAIPRAPVKPHKF